VDSVAWAVWILVAVIIRPQLDGVPIAVVGAMAGLAAVLLCTTPRMLGLSTALTVALGAVFTATVFSPVAIALFSLEDGLLGAGLATLDLAGALPVLVAAGGGSVAILLLARRRGPTPAPESAPARVLIPLVLIVWVLWVVWMVGLESAVDEATSRIVVSGVVAPIASLAVWLIAQRAVHAKTTIVGVVGGLVCGMVSIAPAAAYLDVVGAALTGAIAGAICPLAGYALIRRSGHAAWMLAVVLALGAGIGTGLLGAFATRAGLMFTGQPEVLFSQFASVGLVLLWACAVTGGAWMLIRRWAR
jgi:ammonium transporter, Amt family